LKAWGSLDLVAALIQETARDAVLPRFRQLRSDEIEQKLAPDGKNDLVTVVDRDVEDRLTRALTALVPAMVIGEETSHGSPELLDLIHTDAPLWIVDPIDGTRNFAKGSDAFGIMVAWVVAGQAEAAWVLLPARQQMFMAQLGAGAFMNGRPVRVPPREAGTRLSGNAHTRYLAPPLSDRIARAVGDHFTVVPDLGCSAVEYTDVLQGRQDFTTYYRLLPWDHAAPALILTEAGGVVEHLDGQLYTARSPNQVTVVAGNREVSATVRSHLR